MIPPVGGAYRTGEGLILGMVDRSCVGGAPFRGFGKPAQSRLQAAIVKLVDVNGSFD